MPHTSRPFGDYGKSVLGYADDDGNLSELVLSKLLEDHGVPRHEYDGSHSAREALVWLGY